MSHNREIGKKGEIEAIIYLHKKGYQILKKNYHSRWGEIDIIAQKEDKISFIEVKTRTGFIKGKPHEAVNSFKISKLMRPIRFFLLQNNFKNYKLSLDVISIILNDKNQIEKIKHFENINN